MKDLLGLIRRTDSTREPSPLGMALMAVLALAVGVVSGAGAVVFRGLIALVHNLLFFGQLSFVYNANVHTPQSPWGAGVILVPMLGAIGVAYLVKNFAPDARGHGGRLLREGSHPSGGRGD
jgi:CIC family chloride channel protein